MTAPFTGEKKEHSPSSSRVIWGLRQGSNIPWIQNLRPKPLFMKRVPGWGGHLGSTLQPPSFRLFLGVPSCKIDSKRAWHGRGGSWAYPTSSSQPASGGRSAAVAPANAGDWRSSCLATAKAKAARAWHRDGNLRSEREMQGMRVMELPRAKPSNWWFPLFEEPHVHSISHLVLSTSKETGGKQFSPGT